MGWVVWIFYIITTTKKQCAIFCYVLHTLSALTRTSPYSPPLSYLIPSSTSLHLPSLPSFSHSPLVPLNPLILYPYPIEQVGDRLRLDVQNYRPEKILFARAVKLRSFRKLGRETGLVCEVRDHGFGFVRSHIRDFNIFFRLSEVMTVSGGPVREGDITVGCRLSFDVAEETRGAPSTKLRAVRVQLLPPTSSSPLPSMDGLSIDPDSRAGNGGGSRVSPPAELEQAGGGGLTLLQVSCALFLSCTYRV